MKAYLNHNARALVGSSLLEVETTSGYSGNMNLRFRTNDGSRYFLKQGDASSIDAEVWASTEARKHGVCSPEIVATGSIDLANDNAAFLIMREVLGRNSSSASVWRQVGAQVQALHQQGHKGFGTLAINDGEASGTFEEWSDYVLSIMQNTRRLVHNHVIEERTATSAVRKIELSEVFNYRGEGSLLHLDLKITHIIAQDDKLSGIIDWGDAIFGDPRYEFARVSIENPAIFAAFSSGYGRNFDYNDATLTAYRLLWNLDTLHFESLTGNSTEFLVARIEQDLCTVGFS